MEVLSVSAVNASTAAPNPAGAGPPIRRYLPRTFELLPFGKQCAATLALHLDLYQSHVVQTNAVLQAMAALDQGEEPDAARPAESLSRRLTFELGGLMLHELLFSQYLDCSHASTGSFEIAACHNFGSLDRWRAGVRNVSGSREAGWAVTLLDPHQEFLHTVWVASHDVHVPVGLKPVFVLDLWEHAWLADYGAAGRDDYIEHALLAVSLPCLDARIDAK